MCVPLALIWDYRYHVCGKHYLAGVMMGLLKAVLWMCVVNNVLWWLSIMSAWLIYSLACVFASRTC